MGTNKNHRGQTTKQNYTWDKQQNKQPQDKQQTHETHGGNSSQTNTWDKQQKQTAATSGALKGFIGPFSALQTLQGLIRPQRPYKTRIIISPSPKQRNKTSSPEVSELDVADYDVGLIMMFSRRG